MVAIPSTGNAIRVFNYLFLTPTGIRLSLSQISKSFAKECRKQLQSHYYRIPKDKLAIIENKMVKLVLLVNASQDYTLLQPITSYKKARSIQRPQC